ncbi:MAG TPA: hypothetical protein VF729_09505 [Solirubrobacterales bacterium]
MREQLNSNPLAQLALVGVLLVAVGFFVLSGGGGEEEGETGATSTETTLGVTEPTEGGTASVSLPPPSSLDAPPLPSHVLRAYEANKTVALLFVREGGIDDRLVKRATQDIEAFPDVSLFVIPASRISRYAEISEGVGVQRVPALVVVTPKRLKQTVPTASVSYGFQSPQSIEQAIIDAGYRGPTVDYHP